MIIRLLAFGIAKDILKKQKKAIELPEGASIRECKEYLMARHPGFNKLTSLSFAVNDEYVSDQYLLQDNDEVVLIPPVSGG